MAKHRGASRSRRTLTAAKRAATPSFIGGVAMATVATVAVSGGVPAPQHQASSTARVDLKALITHGSATNWNADGIDEFYGLDWHAKYGPTTISQFSLFPYNVNPDNLTAALRNNVGDTKPDLVLTSGRGSGAASWTMIKLLNSGDPADKALVMNTRWILDNNVNRPNGGYGSRYIPFTILGVYPLPTPIESGADILDVGYEYAWNSSVPAYVSNLPALLNSIIAYAYRYKSQAYTHLPVDPGTLIDDPANPGEKIPGPNSFDPVTGEPILEKGYHYIVAVNGEVTKVPIQTTGTKTAFVTYRAAGLPMLQPIRDIGGEVGNDFADLVQPVLKVLVDAGYPENDPVSNPDVYTPASLFAPTSVTIKALKALPAAWDEGVATLHDDTAATNRSTLFTAKPSVAPKPAAIEPDSEAPPTEPTGLEDKAVVGKRDLTPKPLRELKIGRHAKPDWTPGNGPVADAVRQARSNVDAAIGRHHKADDKDSASRDAAKDAS